MDKINLWQKNQKGISLIIIIVIIIIFIVISGITIAVLTGENSVLNNTKDVADETEKMAERDELSLAVADYWIKEGNLKPVGLSEHLMAEPYFYKVKDYEDVTDDTPKLDVTVRKYTFEVITEAGATEDREPGHVGDGENADEENPGGGTDNPGSGEGGEGSGEGNEGNEGNDDNLENMTFYFNATSTSHSIKAVINGDTTENLTYKYYISETQDGFLGFIPTNESEYLFEQLEHNKEYYIKVEISNGTQSIEMDPIKIMTEKIPDVDENEITFSPKSSTNQNVAIVSIYQKDKYSLMYKLRK